MSDQSTHPPSDDLAVALESLLADKIDPREFTRRIFYLNYEQAKAADPELAEMMRACAIPRAFDAEIIGVLRDAQDDLETNKRLSEELLPFNFVLERQDRGYTYHDNTRRMLQAEWQLEENLPLFEQYKKRLVAFYDNQGQSRFQESDYETALADFNLAVDLESDNGQLYHWRGQTHLYLGDYKAALTDLKRAVTLKFTNNDTYFLLGIAHHFLKDYLASIDNWNKVIQSEPENATAYYNMSLSQNEQGQISPEAEKAGWFHQAARSCERSLEIRPDDPDTLHNLGISQYHLGRIAAEAEKAGWFHQAARSCERSLEIRPDDPDTLHSLASSLIEMWWLKKDINSKTTLMQKAEKQILRAMELAPDKSYYNYACVLALKGNHKQCLAILEEFLRKHPEQKKDIAADRDFESVAHLEAFQEIIAPYSWSSK
ncbi:MAG: tetratricopeptide repeat protein [Desulfobacterales bacterium]|nr:tetratricopeptide repeat protein [Desulfobacterales bacterium]